MIHKKQLLLLVILIIIMIAILPFSTNKSINIWVMVTFWIIGANSILMLTRDSKYLSYSCVNLHWVFCLFFFFISPYVQYVSGNWALYYTPKDITLIKTNIYIIIWMLLFDFGIRKKVKSTKISYEIIDEQKTPSKMPLFIMVTISMLLVIVMIKRVGLITLISSRNGGESVFLVGESSVSLLITYCVRNFIIFTALLNAYTHVKTKRNMLLMVISIILLIIGCSPIGMPRYQTATVYLALILILFPKWKAKKLTIILFIVAFMLLFPLLDVFRYTKFSEVNIFKSFSNIAKSIKNYYTSGNFDAYVMFMKTSDFVGENGYQFGRQLLGALLFFVPRFMWPNKPISTGAMVQNALGWYGAEANVSSPLVAEGMVDFGLFGIIIYSFFLGVICNKIDLGIKNYINNENISIVVLILMPSLIFFLCRGSLLSVWAFIVSFIVIGKIMSFLSIKIK